MSNFFSELLEEEVIEIDENETVEAACEVSRIYQAGVSSETSSSDASRSEHVLSYCDFQ